MAVASRVFDTLINRSSVVAVIPVSKGRLLAATLTSVATLTGTAEAFVQINLLGIGEIRNKTTLALASGYLTSMNDIGWTGNITILPENGVQVQVFSHEVINVQFTVVTDAP